MRTDGTGRGEGLKTRPRRPIFPGMEGYSTWILSALAALFVVAVAIAWFEHLVRQDGREAAFKSPAGARYAAKLDLELDEFAAPIAGDVPERRAAFEGAIARMTGAGSALRGGWLDTAPMVNAGARDAAPSGLAALDTH